MIPDLSPINSGVILWAVFALVVLQIATITMLQKVFADKTTKALVRAMQSETSRALDKISSAVAESTKAALDAYREANTVNEKIARLNARLEELTIAPAQERRRK